MRGVMGRRLGWLVCLTDRFSLVWLLLMLVGLLEVAKLLIKQGLPVSQGSWHRNVSYPARFFVGFGAGAEEEIRVEYCANHSGVVATVNQLDPGSFGSWHRVSLPNGLRSLMHSMETAKLAAAHLPLELSPWRHDFLTYVGMRIGYYAFMHAWFVLLKDRAGGCVTELAFLSADTAAFASADSGLPTCYLQHGMTRYSTLLPYFSKVVALTEDEAGYFRRYQPQADVSLNLGSDIAISPFQMANGVLVASIYGWEENMWRIDSFIQWAVVKSLPIWVRPHPCEEGSFWANRADANHVRIEADDTSFSGALERLRPRLVISWFSTALFDALASGVIPVTVCVDDDSNVADMVYPLFKRSLRWPADAGLIERLLDDDRLYVETLARLREGWESVPA